MHDIIGHQEIRDFFAKAIKNGRLSHAYCFVGPERVGKRTVAENISASLLNVLPDKLNSQPDHFVVEQLFDEKTEKTKKDISISQMRELREYLSKRAYLGGYKVALIVEAEKMNSEAGNALLKTLEEPTEKTVLFLITDNEKALPETIQSRCQIINFQPVAKKEIAQVLKELKVEENEVKEMAKLAHGLPGLALTWQKDREEYLWYKNEVKRISEILGKSFYEKLKAVEELFGDKTDHIKERGKLNKVLDIWQIVFRDVYQKEIENKFQITADLLVKIYDEIESAKKLLAQNVHPRLVVENILLLVP